MQQFKIFNTLTRQKEIFEPLNQGHVGLYVCGPTVYNYAHLGNIRTFLTFDILYRYLLHLGYKVRYVRNITDVGHLVGDGEDGEDKIGRMAKLEQVEPMEIAQRYTNDFRSVLSQLNFFPPNIEPVATGHIIEQIDAIKRLIDKGFAYESNGSVYFDISKYNKEGYEYGKLSGRVIDELINETRELDGQQDKRNPLDFALWKNAAQEHLMKWPSPWSVGFPGWHIECTCMSTKYLGTQFDIHGGGMDLKFPHHECEVAQATSLHDGLAPAKYFMHSNLLTINGQKMSKSLGNSFLPAELFSGSHTLLEQAYSPMTIRFFMLQSQYRSTLDFSNDALKAAQKGYRRLMNGLRIAKKLKYETVEGIATDSKKADEIKKALDGFYEAMNDDLNTAVAIAHVFTLLKYINMLYTEQLQTAAIEEPLFSDLTQNFVLFIEDVLGIVEERSEADNALLQGLLELYKEYKDEKKYDKIDQIRGYFKNNQLIIKDSKNKVDWAYEE